MRHKTNLCLTSKCVIFADHKTLNISLQLQLIKVALSPACICDSAFNYPDPAGVPVCPIGLYTGSQEICDPAFIWDPVLIRDPAFICTVVKKLPAFNGDPAIIGSFTVVKFTS